MQGSEPSAGGPDPGEATIVLLKLNIGRDTACRDALDAIPEAPTGHEPCRTPGHVR